MFDTQHQHMLKGLVVWFSSFGQWVTRFDGLDRSGLTSRFESRTVKFLIRVNLSRSGFVVCQRVGN